MNILNVLFYFVKQNIIKYKMQQNKEEKAAISSCEEYK